MLRLTWHLSPITNITRKCLLDTTRNTCAQIKQVNLKASKTQRSWWIHTVVIGFYRNRAASAMCSPATMYRTKWIRLTSTFSTGFRMRSHRTHRISSRIVLTLTIHLQEVVQNINQTSTRQCKSLATRQSMIGLQVLQTITMVNNFRVLMANSSRPIACNKACKNNNSSSNSNNNSAWTMQWSSSNSIITRECRSRNPAKAMVIRHREVFTKITIHMVETRAFSRIIRILWIKMIQHQCKIFHLEVYHIRPTTLHSSNTLVKSIQQAGSLDLKYIIIQCQFNRSLRQTCSQGNYLISRWLCWAM